MIQKIQNGEYLKRLDNMTAEEREEYLNRVGEWCKKDASILVSVSRNGMASFQNVLQLSAGWNDAECKAWTDGVKLLTALVAMKDTWLPDMLYVKAAKRATRKVVELLNGVQGSSVQGSSVQGSRGEETNLNGIDVKSVVPLPVVESEFLYTEEKKRQIIKKFQAANIGASNGIVGEGNQNGEKKVMGEEHSPQPIPVRPKHIDQYVHLLPPKTQDKAAMVRGLLRDMDVARENARRLMDAGEQGDKVAQWAKTATKLDEKVKKIYLELDAEWEKLVTSGKVTVDDFGNAHVVEPATEVAGTEQKEGKEETEGEEAPKARKPGRPALTEEEKAARQAEKDEERREYLKKWLRDTRTKPSEERKKMWKKNCEELVKLGGKVTESIRKAGEFYGVNTNTK